MTNQPNTIETKAELLYGKKDNQIVHISEVDSGLECDCFCPACNSPLIARKGTIRTHHFAHHQGTDSQACVETALHLFAKQVLMEHKKVRLPEDQLSAEAIDHHGKKHLKTLLINAEKIEFTNVDAEVFRAGYRSDITAYPYENQNLDIEICVSHKVDLDKQEKAQRSHACMMEIDLSALEKDLSQKQIIQAVLYDAPRHWISNPLHRALEKQLQAEVEKLVFEANEEQPQKIESAPLTPKKPDNHMLLGFKVGHGYSPRYQKNFELCKLYTSRQVVSTSTRNLTCSHSGGFELEEFDLDENCIGKLEHLSFPIEVKLIMGSKLHGRKFVPVVLDLKTM
ncbi:competence protein CoiA family protein [Endozoicomonas atrinae]|uniref:competence protein CoiA family protein n=1 Tax=Endozoicomonas atrinae TaxID=1333660 RepID=UPI003AFFA406